MWGPHASYEASAIMGERSFAAVDPDGSPCGLRAYYL